MACALRSDGQLKDATEIDWYNDPDDDSPMAPPPPISDSTLNTFLRRSGRVTKPTEKIRGADDAATIPAKRLPPAAPQNPPPPKRVSTGVDDELFGPEDATDEEEDDGNEAYQRTKEFGDKDRDDFKGLRLKKDERSADLTTIFSPKSIHINPHTQEREYGWWCEICKANNVPIQQCFFKGSISSRRTHIAR